MADYANQQQKIKEATEQLEAGIKDFFSSDKFQEYLNVMSRFHSYSYSNSVMIAMQKPDATLLAGFSGWQKNFDRHVKAGERGIRIFAPAPVKTKVEREKKDPDTKLASLQKEQTLVQDTLEETAVKPAWRCYIVPDLLTWARPDLGKERTEIEYFDTFKDAAARFRGLRTERYNAETSVTDDAGLPCARLTFGIQRENPPSAVDLLHVRAGKNVLSDDFIRMEAVKSDPDALEILSQLGSKVGFDKVLVSRTMTAEEIKEFTVPQVRCWKACL